MQERAMEITLKTGILIGKSACCGLNEITYFTYHFPVYFGFQPKNVLPVLEVENGSSWDYSPVSPGMGYKAIRPPGAGGHGLQQHFRPGLELSKVE